MLSKRYLRNVPLPMGLANEQIFRALKETQAFLIISGKEPGLTSVRLFKQTALAG